MRGSQKPWVHLCRYDVSCKPFPQCSITGVSKYRWAKNSCWCPTSPVQSICHVCGHSVLLKDVLWFLSDLNYFVARERIFVLKTSCKRPILACSPFNPNRRHHLLVQCYKAKWLLMLRYSETSFPTYYPIILFIKDRINGENFLIEKMRIRFPWFLRSFNKQMLLFRRFWIIAALNRNFLERFILT